MGVTTILLDSNFLMLLANRPIKAVEQLEERLGRFSFIVLDDVLAELEGLTRASSPKEAREAASALRYASGLKRVRYGGGIAVDEKIVRYAVKNATPVATLDRKLRRRLRESGVPVVTCSGMKVVVEGLKAASSGRPTHSIAWCDAKNNL